MIRIETAAEQLGIPLATLDHWAELGLVDVHTKETQRLVDQEQVQQTAESIGWLQLSEQNWDSAEE